MTVAIHPINDTDYEALGLATGITETITIASTLYAFSTSDRRNVAGASSGDWSYAGSCEKPTTATEAQCVVSYGPMIARGRCQTRVRSASAYTSLWTFNDPGTMGVETVVRTMPGSPTTPPPDWCTAGPDITEVSVPSSELVHSFSLSSLATYKLIVTAGEEKLRATTGGVASTPTVEPTGSQPPADGSTPTPTSGSGAAAPVKTMAPALAGIGAAVAMFL